MEFESRSSRRAAKRSGKEYIESDDHTSGPSEEIDQKHGMMETKQEDEIDGKGGSYRSRAKSSKKKKKLELSWVKLLFKILVVVVVFYNIKFILNFMNGPSSILLYHNLFVIGISGAINFMAVWILFNKKAITRFYLSLLAIFAAYAYYIYVNYFHQSFMGNNLLTSMLIILSVLILITMKANYYVENLLLIMVPIAGIYLTGNKFALVWSLMLSGALILLFRVSKSKSKSNKKKDREKRKQRESA
ncbi:hypothetical protein HPT25_20640 [Bacillus sp. BRMEA1]|uniref:hypothetical protein n=1 Tax=Neobacillus endophyticus TaxID=2738405 RepID=UPI0015635C63|nr:hypothetical protein [Neobacillus endophyticus]NRD79754.1 hypothetical protein [Neobacillus endophyticus]